MILNNRFTGQQRSTGRNIWLACVAIAVLPIAANASPQSKLTKTTEPQPTDQRKEAQEDAVRAEQVEATTASAKTQAPATQEDHVTFDATILPAKKARLYARIEAYVDEVFVQSGDHVKEGQKLAKLSSEDLENDLRRQEAKYVHVRALAKQASRSIDATRAGLMQARAKLEETTVRTRSLLSEVARSEQELKRAMELDKNNAVSKSEVHKAESQVDAAKGELAVFEAQIDAAKSLVVQHEALIAEAEAGREAAEAKILIAETELKAAKIRLGHAVVRAPFSGIITETSAVAGTLTIPPGRDRPLCLFELLVVDNVTVVGHINANQLAKIRTGMPVNVQLDNGAKVAGKISRISPTVDPTTRTIKVEIDIENRDGKLKVGMFAKVSVEGDKK